MKITTNIMLISAALFFVGCEETENQEPVEMQASAEHKNINDSIPQSRRVFKEALSVWRASYNQLVLDGFFGTNSNKNKLYFPLDTLKNFRNDSVANVNFWIYLESENGIENIPKFAIGNEGDSSEFLICNNDNSISTVDFSALSPKIQNWKNFIESSEGSFVRVDKYRYTWDALYNAIGNNKTLRLETVAHTVEWHNPWFEVEDITHGGLRMEGYIAIDVLISGDDQSTDSNETLASDPLISTKYDFAMPCPKNCPPSKNTN